MDTIVRCPSLFNTSTWIIQCISVKARLPSAQDHSCRSQGRALLMQPPASDQHNVSPRHQLLQLSCFSCSLLPLRLRRAASCCFVRSSYRYTLSLRKALLSPKSACLASPESSCKCQSCFPMLRVLMGCRASKGSWVKRLPADASTVLHSSRRLLRPTGACTTRSWRLKTVKVLLHALELLLHLPCELLLLAYHCLLRLNNVDGATAA